jgi:uncharacterized membrane protein YecN with MAPEG domain
MLAYPVITGLCAGIMGLVAVVLAGHVGSYRGKAEVGIGDGGNAELMCRMRKQGNFTEYTPLALILLGLLEMSGAAGSTVVWVLGAMLVISRILHPLGLKADGSPTLYRMVGMLGTLPMMLVTSIWLIYAYVSAM